MTVICPTPIKGTMMRVVKVDACGAPVTGASSLVVTTAGFVSVGMSPQYEDGEEFFERTADGAICVNQKDDPVLKRMELTVEMCAVDPAMATYVLSATALTVGGDATGFMVPEGQPTNHFSLEVWQRVAGAGACSASGAVNYIYNAWPNVGAVKAGDYTIENGRATFQFTAETSAPSTAWGDGPGTGTSWLPVGTALVGTEHWIWNITDTAPPTGVCGPTLLT
jgi:hypothetical protein